jgi:puromycin-sensitive aminopeptidase
MLGKDFRLPKEVSPRSYDVDLRVDLAAGRFEGTLGIALEVASSRDAIVVHAVGLEITAATGELGDGRQVPATSAADAVSETVTLTFAEALPAGAVKLTLFYHGGFSPGLRGLYRAGPLAVTQFETADARRLFPCFDEPGFKAVWRISVSGVPADAVALSNGVATRDENDGRGGRRVTFAPTPPLSSYLIALIVGPIVPSAVVRIRDVPICTWTTVEKRHLTSFAQETASAVLPRLEDYFGLPYPFGKLDQIGVPDFEAGAMENAGAITFREVALLADPATAPLAVQKRVAEVITHELAHQWFGNLVTMAWWDDLWLNEAFATWMAYKIVDDWRPSWRIWMDFEGGKGAALALDALVSAHPIRAEIKNAEEAGESFDAITYEKGGAVLRMLEGFLGADRFRDGIRLYMRRHREANATADDLWGALGEASGQPILTMANGWIRQVGYPLVSLSLENSATGAVVHMKQRRFFAEPGAAARGSATRWLVPVVLRFRDAVGIKEQPVLLGEESAQVSLAAEGEVAWCLGNAESRGFYRTSYDQKTRARLLPALAELRPAERVNLVSDAWALVRAGEAPIDGFLDLVASLRHETDHVVLDELAGKLSVIEHRFLAEADREHFGAFVADLFGAQAAALGWAPAGGGAEDDEVRLRRAVLLRALVLLAREPSAVAEAEKRLPPSAEGDLGRVATAPAVNLDPNLLDVVVTAAARGADEARFDDLRARARSDADPAAKRRYLHALARVESPMLAARAVELALGPEVAMQDFSSYLGVLLGNRAAREAAFRLIRDRWTETRAKADSPMILRRLVEALATLPERRHFEEVRAFLDAHPIDGAKQATAQTLERMQMDADLRERIIGPVGAWLRGRGGVGRDPQAGVARPGGLLAAALTAAAVFLVGQQVIPHHVPTPLPPPPAVPATAPMPAPPPPLAFDATAASAADGHAAIVTDGAARVDALTTAAGDAAAALPKTDRPHEADATARKPAESDERKRPAPTPAVTPVSAPSPTPASTPASASDKNGEKQSDKDLARESWRRNLPDVSVDGQRAALLIPLKGSTAGSSFHVTNKPHAVIVKLPKAASMITMRLYRIERDGFRLVRINQAENEAKAEDGTELKISLSDSGVVPQVEIKDDFVRVTVRRPGASSSSAAPATPPDAGNK